MLHGTIINGEGGVVVGVRRQPSARTRRAAATLGENLTVTRKLLALTAEQVAERAGINRGTLRRLEQGDPHVGIDVVLDVLRSLGIQEAVIKATDPYETDLGRARAELVLPRRVRR